MRFEMKKQEAVDIFGSQNKLAKALGLTRQAVGRWDWENPIPAKHALRIRYELKPELFEKATA